MEDCAYHVPRLGDPKLDIKRSTVSFGSGLVWDLSKIRSLNAPETTLLIQDQPFCTFAKPPGLAASSQPTEVPMDCQIRCTDDPQAAAERLLALLFYVELIVLPDFYRAAEQARLCLQCRVPPGPALMELVTNLQQRRVRLHYRGSNLDYVSELLVSPRALARCHAGEGLSRAFTIPVESWSSLVDVRIDGLREIQCVSNCPYELRKLARDQGLDSVFGRKDHQDVTEGGKSAFAMFEAIDRLSVELADVTGLWAMRLSAEL